MTKEEVIIYENDLENVKLKEIVKALRKDILEHKKEIMRLGNAIRELVK